MEEKQASNSISDGSGFATVAGINTQGANPIPPNGFGDSVMEIARTRDRERTISVGVDIVANNSFSHALACAIDGAKIERLGWNARGQHVEVYRPSKHEKVSGRFLVIKTTSNTYVPWVPSQSDLFAQDWAIHPFR